MARQHVEVTATTSASACGVYGLLLNRDSVPLWSPMSTCQLHKVGPGDPEGVGAIRKQVMGRTTGYDTIVELVADKRFAYSHQGLPTRDYHGAVDIRSTDGGCVIVWSVVFTPRYPATGLVMRAGIRRFLRQCAHGLADYAADAAVPPHQH